MHSYTVKWGENPITSTIFSEQEILACLVPKMREEEPKTENPLRGPNQCSEFGFEYKQDAISGTAMHSGETLACLEPQNGGRRSTSEESHERINDFGFQSMWDQNGGGRIPLKTTAHGST